MGTMKTFPTLAVLLLLLGGAPLMAGDPATQGSAREGTRVSAMAAALQASTVAVKSMDFNSDGSLTARGSIKMNSPVSSEPMVGSFETTFSWQAASPGTALAATSPSMRRPLFICDSVKKICGCRGESDCASLLKNQDTVCSGPVIFVMPDEGVCTFNVK
ncbi:MAG TPA: hypothetical protein VFC23_17870 [Thermoanaerobaculia bacterium]|nr:hypothetical protein [Thermoanaerobaculia bacterium]